MRGEAQHVRPAVRNAILLGIVAACIYFGFMLLVHLRGG
jgi:hypothetical protein